MANLLLDLEKAYNHVDWEFLEHSMLRMGYPKIYTRGVATPYGSTHYHVLIVKNRDEQCVLSRSIRQGCPLAPTLFLISIEAMWQLLIVQEMELQELRMLFEGA